MNVTVTERGLGSPRRDDLVRVPWCVVEVSGVDGNHGTLHGPVHRVYRSDEHNVGPRRRRERTGPTVSFTRQKRRWVKYLLCKTQISLTY